MFPISYFTSKHHYLLLQVNLLWVSVALFLLSGCLVSESRLQTEQPTETSAFCRQLFAEMDKAVHTAAVQDAESARISGFPYLRVDRFLASFALTNDLAFEAWIDGLRRLDREARTAEFANLPEEKRKLLMQYAASDLTFVKLIDSCGEHLSRIDLNDVSNRRLLVEHAQVSDEYRTSWRVLGIYPLSALVVAGGISYLQSDIYETFAQPIDAIPVGGQLIKYAPPEHKRIEASEVAAIITRTADRPLGIPEMLDSERERLFDIFAPTWEIDVATPKDKIGAPQFGVDNVLKIDTTQPTVYRHLSYTKWNERVLLQLNYIVWFPERPCTGVFDILCGQLDGITWRVTLGPDGWPLIYDAMHNCGCYHMFFPTSRVRVRPVATQRLEPVLVPQIAPIPDRLNQRMVIRLASRTHYLERIYLEPTRSNGPLYQFEDYAVLRSLPTPDGNRRSLFGPDGIVPGTQRAERWILWPMGVPAPGAMRQWGHHPTAFIGRRHFDDAELFERLFEIDNK